MNALLTAAFAVLFVVSGFFLWLGERDHRFLFDGTGTVHETLTLASVALLVGHLYLAVIHPSTRHALRGMTLGDVREDWAREHQQKWVEERARAITAGRRYRYVHADVFTDTPLTGNQLAVFTDARGIDDATMQALAAEIGFSETVFVLPAESGGTARIRIFNPMAEMPFAGHPDARGGLRARRAAPARGRSSSRPASGSCRSSSSATSPAGSCSGG